MRVAVKDDSAKLRREITRFKRDIANLVCKWDKLHSEFDKCDTSFLRHDAERGRMKARIREQISEH